MTLIVRFIIPYHILSPPRAAAFVTFCESNAKALLTLRIKSALRSRVWGFAPPSADGSPAGPPFEKGTLHPA